MSIHLTNFAHGTTTDNEDGKSSGFNDVALSEKGVQQGKDLGPLVKDRHFDVVFCSDLQRAVKTAELAFGDRGIPIIQDVRLRECNYGDYNGGPVTVVEPMCEQNITERFPNGESYEDVKARMQDFLNMLKRDYDGKNIAVISHKAPQLALDVLLKGQTWEEAHASDWRKTKSWQPGWDYIVA